MPVLDGSSVVVSATENYNSYTDGSFKLKTITRGNLTYSAVGDYGLRPQAFNTLMEKKGLSLKSARSEEIKNMVNYFAN